MCEFALLEPDWNFKEIRNLGKRFVSQLRLDIIVYSLEIQASVTWCNIVLAGLGEWVISEVEKI